MNIINSNAKIAEIFNYLASLFPDPKCELNFDNTFQLLCAVILSAQCTDKRVNQITPQLFSKYPTPQHLATASQTDVENIIRSCGFYHNKAKSLISMSADLCARFNANVPNHFQDLLSLRGVGRKTANVVLAVGFNQNELGVDTHIFRIAHRLGMSQGKTPKQVEMDLRELLKGRNLQSDHHYMILFGRYYCKAQNPQCSTCKISHLCHYYNEKIENAT